MSREDQPPTKKNKGNTPRSKDAVHDADGNISGHKQKSLDKEMEDLVCDAKVNRGASDIASTISQCIHWQPFKVNFSKFNFRAAVGSKTKCKKLPKIPKEFVTWDDEIARSGYSEDGELLVMYLPKAIARRYLVCFTAD
jgi:hypothetical protein